MNKDNTDPIEAMFLGLIGLTALSINALNEIAAGHGSRHQTVADMEEQFGNFLNTKALPVARHQGWDTMAQMIERAMFAREPYQ